MLIEKLINSIETEDEKLFGELADKIGNVRAEYDLSAGKLAQAQQTVKTLASELETARNSNINPPNYIKGLENTILELQQQLKAKDASTVSLPIVTSDFKFIDTNVIVFREIKTAIYMNKLLEFIMSTYRIHQKMSGKACMLLVLDPLQDEHRVLKYNKHKYPINTIVPGIPMLITNQDTTELQKMIDLSAYADVTIVDRYLRKQPAVVHSKATTYFLVDSGSDNLDYELDRKKCLAFVHAGETRYENKIDPSTDISVYSALEKAGAIATSSLIARLYCNEV